MTSSFLIPPTRAPRSRKRRIKELAVFGLRKVFVDPAPRPRKANPHVAGFMDSGGPMDFWLPE